MLSLLLSSDILGLMSLANPIKNQALKETNESTLLQAITIAN